MDWKALIEARKSTRAYEPEPVDKQMLEEILEEAAYAPNAMHRNTWQFTALTDAKDIAKLVDVVKDATGREDYTMYHPPVVVIVSDEKDDANARENCACALTYLFLAAANRGLGSVWINQLKHEDEKECVRAYLDEIGVPKNHIVGGLAVIGYPAPSEKPRAEKKANIKIL